MIKTKRIEIIEEEFTDEEIFEKRLFNVFIVSLPRSGSSMMTSIVDKLGVNMIYTSEDKEKRRKCLERSKLRFGDYHPNSEGFFEIVNNTFDNFLNILTKPYSGCKMIIPVNTYRWGLIEYTPCRVIQMWRDPEEIRQSQIAFYKRDISVEEIQGRLSRQRLILENNNIPTIGVNYRNLLTNPEEQIRWIAEFINAPNSIEEAIKLVKPELNRFKKEKLEVGI